MDYCLVIAIARAVTVIESFVLRSLLKIEGASQSSALPGVRRQTGTKMCSVDDEK